MVILRFPFSVCKIVDESSISMPRSDKSCGNAKERASYASKESVRSLGHAETKSEVRSLSV